MVKKDFLTKLQIYVRNSIPHIILKILKETGFDSPLSIKTIDSEAISDLEKYINDNETLHSLLNNSVYANTKPFKFLPGHKLLLLGLKKKCVEFERFEKECDNGDSIVKQNQKNW